MLEKPLNQEEIKSRIASIEASFQDYCQIPIPRRKYGPGDEKATEEATRDEAAKQFIENKSYASPKEMFAYTVGDA